MSLQHGLAAVAVAGSLHGADLEGAAKLIDHQRGQRLAFDLFGNDQQGLARVDDLFENGHQVLDVGDLLLVHEDVSVFEHALHRLRVRDEIRREIPAIELHPLDDLKFGFEALALFDGDHAVFADLLHCVGQDIADFGVAVRGHGADLGDGLLGLALDGHLLEFSNDVLDCLVHAALHFDRIDAGDH